MMKKILLPVVAFLVVGLAMYFAFQKESEESIVIYSGRSKALVDPIIARFQEETGIKVEVKYGGTTQLAVALIEEGSRSPADLFWAQDAGALGAVQKADLLRILDGEITDLLPQNFRNSNGTWVATSGRARVLAYAPSRVDVALLPATVFDLGNPLWKGRIAWAPTNGSFQSFVTAMLLEYGEERTLEWLLAVKNNGAINYANNNAILQGIAAGEADLGITNHYYLFRSKAENAGFPVEQTYFEAGDVGNMVNVAGIAHLKSSKNADASEQFIAFLLSEETQRWFAEVVFEYPVIETGVEAFGVEELIEVSPSINLEELDDLENTLKLLREAGLL
jgi:iron(III) transport system substrate-binding protein